MRHYSAYYKSKLGYEYILDTVPGASLALSLRKLRSAYAGYCIRIRRSSDNAELDIGFVNNWVDIATILTFIGTGSGYIVTWYDQSGNGNNALQTVATAQTLFVADAGVELNNLPVIRFVSNDFFNFSGFSIGNQNSIFIVCKSNNATGPIFASSGYYYNIFPENNAIYYDYPSGNGAVWSGTFTNYSVLNTNQNNLSVGLNINGIAQVNKTLENYPARTIDRLGQLVNSYFFIGDIAEIIVYDSTINSVQISQINNNEITKYG